MAKEMKVIYEEVNSFKSFLDFCCKRANNGENNFFMRKGENGPVHITYNEFREACTRFAAGLLKAGITNKHVAIISENSYEYYVMYFGTVMAGNAFIPLNLTLEEDKLSGLINFADTDIIMISEKYENFREVIENDCPNVKTFISINAQKENELSYDGLIASVTAEEALATEFKDSVYNDETSLLCFTSGTSGGIPKVVMLSVKNILANVRYGSHDIYGEWYPLRLLPLPLYHLAALNFPIYTFMPQSTEMALCTEVKDVFADLYYYKPGYLMAVPAMSEMILKLLEAEVDKMGKREEFEQYNKEADEAGIPPFERRHYAEQFKGIVGGNLVSLTFAGAKSSETIKAALGRFGMFTRDGYGMTECAPMVATEYDECRLGSVGQVCRFNEVKIIDGVA